MRRAAKIDDNHMEIVQALLDGGCTVQSLAGVGCGCPDIVAGFSGITFLVEVKNPARNTASGRRADRESLDAQAAWRERWLGRPVAIVQDRRQALDLVARLIVEMEPPAA